MLNSTETKPVLTSMYKTKQGSLKRLHFILDIWIKNATGELNSQLLQGKNVFSTSSIFSIVLNTVGIYAS